MILSFWESRKDGAECLYLGSEAFCVTLELPAQLPAHCCPFLQGSWCCGNAVSCLAHPLQGRSPSWEHRQPGGYSVTAQGGTTVCAFPAAGLKCIPKGGKFCQGSRSISGYAELPGWVCSGLSSMLKKRLAAAWRGRDFNC